MSSFLKPSVKTPFADHFLITCSSNWNEAQARTSDKTCILGPSSTGTVVLDGVKVQRAGATRKLPFRKRGCILVLSRWFPTCVWGGESISFSLVCLSSIFTFLFPLPCRILNSPLPISLLPFYALSCPACRRKRNLHEAQPCSCPLDLNVSSGPSPPPGQALPPYLPPAGPRSLASAPQPPSCSLGSTPALCDLLLLNDSPLYPHVFSLCPPLTAQPRCRLSAKRRTALTSQK